MTDTRKLEDQTPENKSKVTGGLTDSELNQVSGGANAEDKQQAEALKTFQQVLQKAGQI
jgi:bacteriocin-like protein